jgi:ribosomal protein L3 glutamine methyltransferase
MTLIELVDRCTARLTAAGVSFGHGTACARDEAAWLVLWRLGLRLDDLDGVAARALGADEVARVQALVDERIATRKPAAYLTGEAWLQGVPFNVDERVIVPRSLIAEVLAEGLIDAWLGPEPARVLDLCTGNGSLAVLAAMAWSEACVDAADLSADALAVAASNLRRHGLEERIGLFQGDGLAAVATGASAWRAGASAQVAAPAPVGAGMMVEAPPAPALHDRRGRHSPLRPYDLILCNPPYVNARSMAALPLEYQAEPALALAGGDDGMDFIRPLLADAAAVLTPGGALVLEIGHERAHFERAFPRLEPVWLPCSAGDEQVLLLTREAL